MQIKPEHFIKPYDGTGSWPEWIRKFKRVADQVKWETDVDRCENLTLFLEGSPLLIVERMPADKRKSFEAICTRLSSAFMPSPTVAHAALTARRWNKSESVEVLYYDIVDLWKNSAGLSGKEVDESTEFTVALPFFLAAIPPSIAAQIRTNSTAMSGVDGLFFNARSLLNAHAEVETAAEVVGAFGNHRKNGQRSNSRANGGTKRCYRCGDVGHMSTNCWSPVGVCYTCKKPGHNSQQCRSKKGKPTTAGNQDNSARPKNALQGKSDYWSDLPTHQ
jgi:hypothetical protein